MSDQATLHDAYAADYDAQVSAYDCYLAEALFGLCYDFVQPGQSLLDLGIGSGLSAAPFARAGLRVAGMDFAPAMLGPVSYTHLDVYKRQRSGRAYTSGSGMASSSAPATRASIGCACCWARVAARCVRACSPLVNMLISN